MIDNILNIDEVTEAYLFSNNARSLWRVLRNNPSVNAIARLVSSDVLDQEFSELLSSEIINYEQIAKLYSIFIALSLKQNREVDFFFNKYRELKFEWFLELRRMFDVLEVEATVVYLSDRPKDFIINEGNSETTMNNTSSITLIN